MSEDAFDLKEFYSKLIWATSTLDIHSIMTRKEGDAIAKRLAKKMVEDGYAARPTGFREFEVFRIEDD